MTLSITHIRKTFSDRVAVADVTFEAQPGRAFALLGANGAGKTTCIRMILGLFEPDAGSISYNGGPILPARVSYGYLPEERGLYPKSRIVNQLVYFGRLRGMSASNALKSARTRLERLYIADDAHRRVDELSKGNQQKVQLIAALINDPELVVLDEPFSGLDPVNSELLQGIVRELIERGRTVVFSSHEMSYVESFCEDICILKAGRAILQGNLRAIKRSYDRSQLSLRAQGDVTSVLANQGLAYTQTVDGYTVRVPSERSAQVLLRALVEAEVAVEHFALLEPSLHQIFIEKVGDNAP
jgi:ABC-2 type transport system ATP-binding protein